MQISLTLLPELAAMAFLVFARIGTMVMLLPGIGERSVPVRFRLTVALMLTLVMLPLHGSAYSVDPRAPFALFLLLFKELLIGVMLGLTARLALTTLQTAGTIIAQQVGLGFVTQVDPTQGQQGVLVGNLISLFGVAMIFATDMHLVAITALSQSYTVFAPGVVPESGHITQLIVMAVVQSFKIALQISAPFLVFGLIFNLGLGVLARLMPQMQVFFIGVPISIMGGFLLFAALAASIFGLFLDHYGNVMKLLVGSG